MNKRCSADVADVLISVDAVESVSITIVDNIFPPALSEVTCLHPILIKLLPCLVSLYPY